jgi:hypothetical protein
MLEQIWPVILPYSLKCVDGANGRIVGYSDKGGCGADATRRTGSEETSDTCP